MTTFYISDTHFDHAKIIRLAKRPFASIEQMNQTMLDQWNARVTMQDDVYFLGDFAWHNHEHWFEQLSGRKHMIWGNHDQGARKLAWASTQDYLEIQDGSLSLVLFHYPIYEWNGLYKGSYHFYGHVHDNQLNEQTINWKARAFNVGVEALNYTPQTALEIVMAGNE